MRRFIRLVKEKYKKREKRNTMTTKGPDDNRDPNGLNEHVQVQYEDVFGEPSGVRSFDCVWDMSRSCFECGKQCCYKMLTVFCGMCIALYWGCEFGVLSFDHVWCWTPFMRDFSICVGCWQKFFGTCLGCCLAPVCEACGTIFTNINVKVTKA